MAELADAPDLGFRNHRFQNVSSRVSKNNRFTREKRTFSRPRSYSRMTSRNQLVLAQDYNTDVPDFGSCASAIHENSSGALPPEDGLDFSVRLVNPVTCRPTRLPSQSSAAPPVARVPFPSAPWQLFPTDARPVRPHRQTHRKWRRWLGQAVCRTKRLSLALVEPSPVRSRRNLATSFSLPGFASSLTNKAFVVMS